MKEEGEQLRKVIDREEIPVRKERNYKVGINEIEIEKRIGEKRKEREKWQIFIT